MTLTTSSSPRCPPCPPPPARVLISEAGAADPTLAFPQGAADPALCHFMHDAMSLYFAAIPGYMNISSAGYGAGNIIPSELRGRGGCGWGREGCGLMPRMQREQTHAWRSVPPRLPVPRHECKHVMGARCTPPLCRPAGGGGDARSEGEAGGGGQPVLQGLRHPGPPGRDQESVDVDGVRCPHAMLQLCCMRGVGPGGRWRS